MTKQELSKAWNDAITASRSIENQWHLKNLQSAIDDAFKDAMRDIGVPEDEIYIN